MSEKIRILGLDPSLVACGWGVIEAVGTKVSHIAHGVVRPPVKAGLPARLNSLYDELANIVQMHAPDSVGVEEAFMKNNAMSALKLGHARAICLLVGTQAGLSVGEYAPRVVKKAVTGTGGADKEQVAAMMNVLLPGCGVAAGDAADALAIAVCHAQRVNYQTTLKSRLARSAPITSHKVAPHKTAPHKVAS